MTGPGGHDITAAFPPIGLGCSRMGSFNNPQTASESRALVDLAMDLGVTLFDTANIYGQGDSERILGKALAGKRHHAQIVTKAGQGFSAKMRLLRPFKPLLRPLLAREGTDNAVTAQRDSVMRTDWARQSLIASLDASLRRLRSDHVDVFLLHSPPAEVIAQGEAAEALRAVRDAGKARAVGVACDDLPALDAALALGDLVGALELPWDMLDAIRGDQARLTAIGSRIVLAREVLRLQPGVEPMAAITAAVALPFVTTTLVGTRRPERLGAVAARFPERKVLA